MRLHHRHWGAAGKPALLFLHGFMGDSGEWEPVAKLLQDRYFCVAVDLPGHGGSEVPMASPFIDTQVGYPPGTEWIRAMDALLEDLKANGSLAHGWKAIVGYSMGGRMAMALALAIPNQFGGMVLESASPGIGGLEERARRLEADLRLADDLTSMPLRSFIERWYTQPMFGPMDDREALFEERSRQDPAALAAAMRWLSVGRQPDYAPRLAVEWKKPLLCLAGSLDGKYASGMEALAGRAAFGRFKVAPGSGHNVHRHDPGAYGAWLSEFLAGY